MSDLNFVFKIIENDKENEQIAVKYCVQTSKRSINEVPTLMIDYDKLDFGTYENLIQSICRCGKDIAIANLSQDPILEDNKQSVMHEGPKTLDELINKTMVLSNEDLCMQKSRLKKIILEDI